MIDFFLAISPQGRKKKPSNWLVLILIAMLGRKSHQPFWKSLFAALRALIKLKEINSFCSDVLVANSWVKVSQQSDLKLWNLLTNDDIHENNIN